MIEAGLDHAQLGFGQVRHARLRPARNAFAYATCFLMLPMRSGQWGGLARNRFAPISFADADHGDGRPLAQGGALAWLDELLAGQGITDATGQAWLQCYPRVLGYTFKPVSFWYCHAGDGRLRCVVVEVNNTFGERHVYLLDQARYGRELKTDKVFHVSPFCSVEGNYRFRFMRTEGRLVARIEHDDAQGLLITTSLSGMLKPAGAQELRRAFWAYPLMTFGVIALIHWQALRLWLKRVPFFSKPEPPAEWLTR